MYGTYIFYDLWNEFFKTHFMILGKFKSFVL